ncbi:MAG: hypothetical protein HY817_00060 [Candidatus Abawacabacteria bacterium]|nr:hypothetical protein [Candidatus Abawacabacteria bacterium]
MEATCIVTGKQFSISDHEQEYCHNAGIPLPKLHPQERLKRILNFRNRTFLYNTTCASSKKPILSCIPPDKGFTVYDVDAWNGDDWDALSYGKEYDPQRNFFDQLGELLKAVPLPNLTVVRAGLENSDYCNGAANLKNCYLCFASVGNSDCMFCWNTFDSKNVVNCISAIKSELCYHCRDIENCYRVCYAESSNYCSESYFLESCQSCKHCFACVNLSNKEYCWYNEQLTKEEFEMRRTKFAMGSLRTIEEEMKKFAEFKKRFPQKAVQGRNNENSTGNYIHNCKDCRSLFHGNGSIDVENCIGVNKSKDVFCTAFCTSGELLYNCQAGINNYNNQYCAECVQTRNMLYCLYCMQGSSDCFGCVSLKKKQYCVLNKQYSKEEYEKLVQEIKRNLTERNEWEEFFPSRLSPMHYNHSDGAIILPVTKEEAIKLGFTWEEETPQEAFAAYQIPDNIKDVKDDILQGTLQCATTGKKFRLTKQELEFYREMGVPIPRQAPLERVHQNAAVFRITEVKKIPCSNCHQKIESIYDPQERAVLCEECYLKEHY